MNSTTLRSKTSVGALTWLLDHEMVIRSHTQDPETFARVQTYLLSEGLREKIGFNLVKLFDILS
jgi:hypothetical protein